MPNEYQISFNLTEFLKEEYIFEMCLYKSFLCPNLTHWVGTLAH